MRVLCVNHPSYSSPRHVFLFLFDAIGVGPSIAFFSMACANFLFPFFNSGYLLSCWATYCGFLSYSGYLLSCWATKFCLPSFLSLTVDIYYPAGLWSVVFLVSYRVTWPLCGVVPYLETWPLCGVVPYLVTWPLVAWSLIPYLVTWPLCGVVPCLVAWPLSCGVAPFFLSRRRARSLLFKFDLDEWWPLRLLVILLHNGCEYVHARFFCSFNGTIFGYIHLCWCNFGGEKWSFIYWLILSFFNTLKHLSYAVVKGLLLQVTLKEVDRIRYMSKHIANLSYVSKLISCLLS
jgi:hypothetical protein